MDERTFRRSLGGNLMFDLLLYANMSCTDAQKIIDRVYEYNQKSEFITRKDADEIAQVIKESTPECFNEGSEYNP